MYSITVPIDAYAHAGAERYHATAVELPVYSFPAELWDVYEWSLGIKMRIH